MKYLAHYVKPHQSSSNWMKQHENALSLNYDTAYRIAQENSYGFNEFFIPFETFKSVRECLKVEKSYSLVSGFLVRPEFKLARQYLFILARSYRRLCDSKNAHVHMFRGEIYFDGCD